MTTDGLARRRRGGRILGIGEAMVEFAPVGDGLYRRGFAGDTLNTCWHMAQLLGDRRQVAYLTRVGTDASSDELVAFVAANGMDASLIGLRCYGALAAPESLSPYRDALHAALIRRDGR